jgi:AbrB family looped-hinge helix DNA binding protein
MDTMQHAHYHYCVIPGDVMETTSVTIKGQVTIPKKLRQRLGIRQGSRVEFLWVDDHVEMRVKSSPATEPSSGFGLLKSKRAAVTADFDPATLLKK